MSKTLTVNKKEKFINPYFLVLLSFLLVILIGGTLISLPFARLDGQHGNWLDSVFAATSATCVTGLCTFSEGIGGTLNIWGQIIFIILIQVGGLGFITILTFIITLFKNKLTFRDRYRISQMVNSTNIADVVTFVRKLILISFVSETIGFALGIPVFIQMFPEQIGKALWNSLFMSVSAFNNAGFDLLGSSSLIRDMSNSSLIINNISDGMYAYMLIYLMFLIIVGGISFLVILDVFNFKKRPSQWRPFTKIVLCTTSFLLISGFIIFFLTEHFKANNQMSVLHCIFQSVTLRTAGFASYDQNNLSMAGKLISCFFMLIGGSPLSTAGGIKTTTLFIIVLTIVRYLSGEDVVAFKRKYKSSTIIKAMTLSFLGFIAIIIGFVLLTLFENDNPQASTENILFEVFSAFGTTGVSTNLTTTIGFGSKIVIICLMFVGRLGPITFFQLIKSNLTKDNNIYFNYPEEDFLVG